MLDGGDTMQLPMPLGDEEEADPVVECPIELTPPPPPVFLARCPDSDDDYEDDYYDAPRRTRLRRATTAAGGGDEEESAMSIRFVPPVYLQRYQRCIDVLRECQSRCGDLVTVVDFGCAEGKFLARARFALPNTVRRLVGVDVDEALLWQTAVNPLKSLNDAGRAFFLDRRRGPLRVQLFAGSAIDWDDRLGDVDAVVAIELIEHLHADVLDAVPEAIFGRLRPRLVILTTPNADFNPVFKMTPGTFRHFDHKFEWTRAQFEHWCNEIVAKYGDYAVRFDGVGELPPARNSIPKGTKHESPPSATACDVSPPPDFGFCSQIAIFECLDYKAMKARKVNDLNKRLGADPPIRPYRKLLDHTYLYDEKGNRRCRIRCEMMRICESMYATNPELFLLEKYGRCGERAVIALDAVFKQLDPQLKLFCVDKWEAADLVVERSDDWQCTMYAKRYECDDAQTKTGEFGVPNFDYAKFIATQDGFPANGYLHMPVVPDRPESPEEDNDAGGDDDDDKEGDDVDECDGIQLAAGYNDHDTEGGGDNVFSTAPAPRGAGFAKLPTSAATGGGFGDLDGGSWAFGQGWTSGRC